MSRAALAAALAGLVAVAPWPLGFADSHAAVAAGIAFAMAFAPIALLSAELPAAALATVLAGGWLMLSPWALGFGPSVFHPAAGLALIVLAAGQHRRDRQHDQRQREPQTAPAADRGDRALD
jgi:hypothetical protein